MMLIAAFTLCLAFAYADYSNNYGQFRPHVRPNPEPQRPTEPPRPTRPDLAVVDKDKVQEFFDRFCQYLDAKDLDSILNLYADDLVFIQAGGDAAGKEAFRDYVTYDLFNENGPCDDRISLISGDYYYPYWWAKSYSTDGYGREMVTEIFSEVLRLKEDGDYEIVLTNSFVLDNGNNQVISNGYGDAVQQPNGYGNVVTQQPNGYGNVVTQQPNGYGNVVAQQPNGYGGAVQQPNGYGQTQRIEQPRNRISRPVSHYIPQYRPQQPRPIPQQPNGYGQIPQQLNGYGQ